LEITNKFNAFHAYNSIYKTGDIQFSTLLNSIGKKLDFETSRGATTTGTLEFASLGTDIGFDTVVGVRVVDRSTMSKVCESLPGLRTTKQDRT
jgi:hypothetical protein